MRHEQVHTPYEYYKAQANRFVAGFLGKANFIEKRERRDAILSPKK